MSIVLSIATFLIRWYVGNLVFSRIESLVNFMLDSELPNDKKRTFVIASIKTEFLIVQTRVIDMVIGLVLTGMK